MNFHSQHSAWAVVLFLALTSCEEFMGDGWPGFRMSEAEYVVLDPDISSMTRVRENAFELSDEIGVCITKNTGEVYADNVRFVFDGNLIQSPDSLKWYEGNTKCSILAYYPYKVGYSESSFYNYDVAIDQSSYADFSGSDLLYGFAHDVTPGGGTVKISFEHCCTQFQVSVTNRSKDAIQSVKFVDLEYHQSLFGFGAFSGDNVSPADIIPYHYISEGKDVYKAIVPSMQTNLFQVEIETSSGLRLFRSDTPFTFVTGMMYVVDIILDDRKSGEEITIAPKLVDWMVNDLPMYENGDVPSGGGGGDSGSSFSSFEEVYNAATGYTHTSATPMGNHYVGAHVTTDADRKWLLDPSNEPPTLPSAPSYTWKEYNVTLFPFGEPKPADVNQHGIGDCSACAVFAEMAYVAPKFIKSIIKDNGNKTYTVNMYDPQGNPVDVCISSRFLGDSSIGEVSGKNNVACWSTILEKAMIKWEAVYQVNPDVYGIGSEHVAPLFTGDGDSFAFYPGTISANEFRDAVNLSFDNKCILIGGFTQSGAFVGSSQTVSGHAYSFHRDSNSNVLFAMRNPWGYSPGDSGYTDGLLHIKNDGFIPTLLDIRIIRPGVLAAYYEANLGPYVPPVFANADAYQTFLQKERVSKF